MDGVECIRDYHGHREYLSDLGLLLYAAIYRSPRGETMFKRVRFEINP